MPLHMWQHVDDPRRPSPVATGRRWLEPLASDIQVLPLWPAGRSLLRLANGVCGRPAARSLRAGHARADLGTLVLRDLVSERVQSCIHGRPIQIVAYLQDSGDRLLPVRTYNPARDRQELIACGVIDHQD